MGLDLGSRRIGIALSDSLGLTAQRLTVLERRDPQQDLAEITALARTHEVGAIVVGLPLTLGGQTGRQATEILRFVEALRGTVTCPVQVLDERLTTVEGERSLIAAGTRRRKRKQLIDQVAAQLILQAYLDAHRTR